MPQTTRKRPIAHRARKSALPGNNKKESRRPGIRRTKKKNPAVLANSVFALTLSARPAASIVDRQPGKGRRRYANGDDDFEKMYEDLKQAFHIGVKLATGESTSFDPLKSGLDIGLSLGAIINGFKNNILPKEFEMNVDKDDDHYYFTIYKYIELPWRWHVFEIKPVVTYLKKVNPRLHDLFIFLIKAFVDLKDIPTWYNGGFGYAEYQLEQEIDDWESYHDIDEDDAEQQFESAKKTWKEYQEGEAAEYKEILRRGSAKTPQWIANRLKQHNSRNPVVKWMKTACEWLQLPGFLGDFTYPELRENDDSYAEGLDLDQQIAIGWDLSDEYTACQEQSMDATASGVGVVPAFLTRHFSKHTREYSLEDLENRASWLLGITKVQKDYLEVVEVIGKKIKPKKKHERKNRIAIANI